MIERLFKHRRIKGEEVDLVERSFIPAKWAIDGVGAYYFDICLHDSTNRVGHCDLRLSCQGSDYYYGHIGYHIFEDYRGHHYALKACQLLLPEAKKLGFSSLVITCNPDNIASYKTIVALGGKLLETVKIPPEHDLYRVGDRYKCIFEFKLD